MIEHSLGCFLFGLLSLIPLLGLPFVFLALGRHWRLWSHGEQEWNPAKRYLVWGYGLAWLGGLISLGAAVLFVIWLKEVYGF